MTHGPLRMVAFDIDGVIVRGGTVLPGAARALDEVLRRGLLLRFVTNNSTRHRSEIAERLAGLGLPVTAELVLTSAAATARWLRSELGPGARVLVVGEAGLVRELCEAGLDAAHAREWGAGQRSDDVGAPDVDAGARDRDAGAPGGAGESRRDARAPDSVTPAGAAPAPASVAAPAAVVAGLDRGFDYDSLAAAQDAILHGALFVATNTDATFPVEGAVRPGGGAIVAAVAVASGREPVVIGKPESRLAEALVDETGTSPDSILFVGDRLETDIEMARRAGMRSALVLTGVTKRSELGAEGLPAPDHVLESLDDLPALLDDLGAGSALR